MYWPYSSSVRIILVTGNEGILWHYLQQNLGYVHFMLGSNLTARDRLAILVKSMFGWN